MKQRTSFGSMETLLEKDGEIVSELLVFEREGRPHSHSSVENCYILEGKGFIMNGDMKLTVSKGSVCSISPNTPHWMIPDGYLEILLVYSQE